MILKRYLGLLILVISIKMSFAQTVKSPFIFDNFTDGGSTLSNIIGSIFEDKDGYLWMGTNSGLKRFDGKNFELFKHYKNNPKSLIHSVINGICEDKMGRIWLGTGEGVCYFDKKTNDFTTLKEFNRSDYICFNILSDHEGNIWFTIRLKGLYKYDVKTNQVQKFVNIPKDKYSLNENSIDRKNLILDPHKKGLWIITFDGLNFFDFTTKKFHNRNNSKQHIFKNKNFSGIAADKDNLILYNAESQTLLYYNLLSQTFIEQYPFKGINKSELNRIANIFVDNQRNLWMSDWFNHAYFLDFKTKICSEIVSDPSRSNSISTSAFWSAYQHKDGSVWLGTNNGTSITKLEHKLFEVHDIDEIYKPSHKEDQIYLFMEDGTDGTWWIANSEHSFINYNPLSQQLFSYKIPKNPKNPFPKIISFLEYQTIIYIATSDSFYSFNKKSKKMNPIPLPFKMEFNKSISNAMQKGDSIWLFAENMVAYSFKIPTKKWRSYPILNKMGEEIVSSEMDNDGNIWLGHYSTGLSKFSKKKQAFEAVKILNLPEFKKPWYNCLRKDFDGNIWIGSHYELMKINPKNNTYLEALDINLISDALIDNKNNIWTQTFNDFSVYNPKTKKTLNITLPVDKRNFNTLWKNTLYSLKNGEIISLIKNNIVKIDPSKLNVSSNNGKVLISNVVLADSNILLHNTDNEILLKSIHNDFTIQFSVLNRPGYNALKYSYQLIGFNKNWITAIGNSANFSNLDGGDYKFKVKGIDRNGVETPVSILEIHIDTVLYKSKWLFALIALTILGLIFIIYRYRINQTNRFHHLELQTHQLKKDKSEIQYQNLINHLNPHFLFNSLSSLSSLIESEDKAVANKFLDNLSKIYRYILKSRESETVPLMNELKFTKNYINLQKNRFPGGFEVIIDIIDEFNYRKIVPVTIQNLIENAIKHNIIDEESPLIINIFIEEDYLVVSNNLQLKKFVETSNQQGLESMKSLYKYLTNKPLNIKETEKIFSVYIPLI